MAFGPAVGSPFALAQGDVLPDNQISSNMIPAALGTMSPTESTAVGAMVDGSVSAHDATHPREALVSMLTNFLKEYYLSRQDGQITAMLHDIAGGSTKALKLGNWGEVSAADVAAAIADFEVWKTEGCKHMPAVYISRTHDREIECVIVGRNPDSTLDLMSDVGTSDSIAVVKRKADPSMVKPRAVLGWFVPTLEQLQASAATTNAGAAPTHGGQKEDAGEGQASIPPPPAPPPPPAASRQDAWKVLHSFEGTQYGEEYLVLNAGDFVTREKEETGWAFGEIVVRADAVTTAPHTLQSGWFPSAFLEKV